MIPEKAGKDAAVIGSGLRSQFGQRAKVMVKRLKPNHLTPAYRQAGANDKNG
jgi:hypothetical protein